MCIIDRERGEQPACQGCVGGVVGEERQERWCVRLGERKRKGREPTEKEESLRRDGENKAKAGGRATRPSCRVSGDFFRFLTQDRRAEDQSHTGMEWDE